MPWPSCKTPLGVSRSPHGERGLKFKTYCNKWPEGTGRSPHGERGLKSNGGGGTFLPPMVALLMESVD